MIKRNLAFFIPYILWLLVAGYFLFSYEKAEIHIFLNQFHHRAGDIFFRWYTHTGDGLFAGIVILFLLIYSYGKAFVTGLALITSTIITQFLKRVIYFDEFRPGRFFRDITLETPLHFIPEVSLHSHNSFPSGHANTAFCLFLALSFFTNNHFVKFLLFVAAILSAYSRVYLSQHFLVDIYFGSLWAVGITMLVFYIFDENRMRKISWADRSLIKRK